MNDSGTTESRKRQAQVESGAYDGRYKTKVVDMFDEDYIDPIDKWIEDNNADVKKIKSVSYRKVKQLLEQDYAEDAE